MLLAGVTRTVLQTALDAEMTEHLGYAKGDPTGRGASNHRNGGSAKTVHTEVGPVSIEAPRERATASIRRACRNIPGESKDSTNPSSRCMPKGWKPARSRRA